MSLPQPPAHTLHLGAGTPLLFIHGNGVDHTMMLDLDPVFSDSQWERIYIDLPGCGLTPPLGEPGGLPEVAAWLSSTVDSLIGDTPFAMVGTSLGGVLTRYIAATRQDQCLGFALLAPVVDPIRENRTVPDHSVVVPSPQLIASLDPMSAEMYEPLAVIQTVENWEKFRDVVLPGLLKVNTPAMERLAENYALEVSQDSHLVGFDQPVLVVTGRQDSVVGFQDQWLLSQQFPHCTFAVIDGAGHNIQIDQPTVVRGLLAEWQRQISGPKTT